MPLSPHGVNSNTAELTCKATHDLPSAIDLGLLRSNQTAFSDTATAHGVECLRLQQGVLMKYEKASLLQFPCGVVEEVGVENQGLVEPRKAEAGQSLRVLSAILIVGSG